MTINIKIILSMSVTNKEQTGDRPSGKDTRKNLEQQLSTLLTGWKEELGEKKFKTRIKKAAKLLSKGLPGKKKEAPAIKKKAAAATKTKKAKAGKKAAASETTA
jgi:hypothetical protein